jgi:soluble lytic murein transglycosylase-like protein
MNKIKFATVAIFVFISMVLFKMQREPSNNCKLCLDREASIQDPPCLQMYFCIEKYAEMYKIPKKYAYGIAFAETRYEGPFHWKYTQKRTSTAGALGPMQIMPSTARMMWPDSSITNNKLMTDIEFNVHTSMKLLRKLHNRYGDWKVVFGAYNTGRPCINGYAQNVYSHKPKF